MPTVTKAVKFGDPVRINALLDQPGTGAVPVKFQFRRREPDLKVHCEDSAGTKTEKDFDEVTTTMGGGHATISWRAAGPKRGDEGSALIYCQAIVGTAAPVEVAFQEWLVYYDTLKITATNADGGEPMRREAVELRPAGKGAQPIRSRTDDNGVVLFTGVPASAFEVVWLDCNVEGDYDTPLHHGGEHTVTLKKPPVKVAIHWPPTGGGTHKQIVNLAAGVAGHPEFGPSLPLVLRTTEGVPRGPVEVHVKATFGDKNLRRTHTDTQVRPHAQLPAGFARQADGSWLWTKTVALAEWQDAGGAKEVTIPIAIGSCGGDTITLGASTVKENPTPEVKVENWRQVFYNAFATAPLKQTLVDALAATNASLAPHFISIANARTADGAPSVATVADMPANIASTLVVDGAKRWFDTSKNELFRQAAFQWLNAAPLSTRNPQLLRIHMVDYFFTPPAYTRVTAPVVKGKATYKAGLGKNFPPGADAVVPDNAQGDNGTLIQPPKFGTPVITADRKSFTVDVKASGAKNAEFRVKEASTYRGFTSLDLQGGGPPVFGLRPETNQSSTLYTLRHEFAHAFDEVKDDSSRGVENYEHPAHPFRVLMQGWTGTHCVFGLKEKLPASEQGTFNKDRVAHYGNEYHEKNKFGTCLMWGTGFGDDIIQHQPNDFCEHCAKAIKANRFGRA